MTATAIPAFPTPSTALQPTTVEALDAAVERLAKSKGEWANTPIPKRIAYLHACLEGVNAVAEAWVRDICRIKGLAPDEPLAGEEWLAGPVTTARNIRLLIDALQANGQPRPPKLETRSNGQHVATVFPRNAIEKLTFSGFRGEVWIEPGKPATQGRIYRDRSQTQVALVLGAGNVSSIPPMDLLYKLFVDNEVVILKMNPVNEVVGPHLECAFKCLIEAGFLSIVYGGASVGAHLAAHPKVDTLHVTGSDRTYDAIVWGSDPTEQAQRKQQNTPLNPRPFTAELGCVTPVLVVPGPWSESDLDFQARHIAGMVAQNGSFNCNAAKAVVVAKGWDKAPTLVKKIKEQLAQVKPRRAYYPGALDRYRGFIDNYPQAEIVGKEGAGVVPWTIIPDVPPRQGEYALTHEAFCGVLAVVELEATTAEEFLTAAVPFANDTCWGTLSCVLLVDETTRKRLHAQVDATVESLRYGGIGINVWPGVIYALTTPTWGAFPGHDATDIQSGTGVVHNALLFDHPQKSVLHAPFRIRPTPAWFADNRNLHNIGRRMLKLESTPSLRNLLGVVGAAIRG